MVLPEPDKPVIMTNFYFFVLIGCFKCLVKLFYSHTIKSIEFIGPVDGNGCDSVLGFGKNIFVVHDFGLFGFQMYKITKTATIAWGKSR